MVKHCCVPTCDSNSSGKRVSFFKFPKNRRLRELWKKQVQVPLSSSSVYYVCMKHFHQEDIIKKGRGLNPKLLDNALPCLFLPSSSEVSGLSELSFQDDGDDDDIIEDFLMHDKVESFQALSNELSQSHCRLSHLLHENGILLHSCNKCISFLLFSCSPPRVKKCLKVHTNLSLSLYIGEYCLTDVDILQQLDIPQFLTCWSALEDILVNIKNFQPVIVNSKALV